MFGRVGTNASSKDGNITINSSDTTYSFAKTETAHSKVLTITTFVNGVEQKDDSVSIEFDTWAYPDADAVQA